MRGTAIRTDAQGANRALNLPEGLIALLRQPSLCFLATVMPDGSPQVTQTWADTDGAHVVINSVRGHQKVTNVQRDPRVDSTYATRPARPATTRSAGRSPPSPPTAARSTSRRSPTATWAPPTRGTGVSDQVRVILTITAASIHQSGWARQRRD